MISATRSWFKRNRTNFAIGAGVLGAGYLATQYVLSKVSETRQRMSDERIAKENLRRRFGQNQEDCTFTVLAILPTATENILQALPVEATLAELQRQKAERLARSVGAPSESDALSVSPSLAFEGKTDGESTSIGSESFVHASQVDVNNTTPGESAEPSATPQAKKSKVQLWNEVKISSISRAFTLIYTISLLTLLTRIQLNLLGRRTYLASVVSLASPPSSSAPHINLENHDDDNYENGYGNDFETNRKYLSFSWWLLHKGCRDIMQKVQAAVQEAFSSVSPREDLTLARLSELTLEVRRKIEGATPGERRSMKWLSYLLPPSDQELYVLQESGMAGSPSLTPTQLTTPSLRRLLDETSDLIDSPPFTHVLTFILDTAFSHLIDTKLATLSYKLPPVSPSPARIQELINPDEAKAKVANSLAVFCRQAHSIGAGESNEYLTKIEEVKELEAFAAVVYSSHFEFESLSQDATDKVAAVQESFVDLGTSRPPTADGDVALDEGRTVGFESAWGKALRREDGDAS